MVVTAEWVERVGAAIVKESVPGGAEPAGLGAGDATRLEAAVRLYGNDMDTTVNPSEAGLGWTVRLDKGAFIGRDALVRVKADGAKRSLVGLQTSAGDIAPHGAAVRSPGRAVGSVTSGTHPFFLCHPLALAVVAVTSIRVGGT